jgi:hypothetical protein
LLYLCCACGQQGLLRLASPGLCGDSVGGSAFASGSRGRGVGRGGSRRGRGCDGLWGFVERQDRAELRVGEGGERGGLLEQWLLERDVVGGLGIVVAWDVEERYALRAERGQHSRQAEPSVSELESRRRLGLHCLGLESGGPDCECGFRRDGECDAVGVFERVWDHEFQF